MKYIAVCKDVWGNVFEMEFNSQEERTDFITRPWTCVLFTFEREEGKTYLISSFTSNGLNGILNVD